MFPTFLLTHSPRQSWACSIRAAIRYIGCRAAPRQYQARPQRHATTQRNMMHETAPTLRYLAHPVTWRRKDNCTPDAATERDKIGDAVGEPFQKHYTTLRQTLKCIPRAALLFRWKAANCREPFLKAVIVNCCSTCFAEKIYTTLRKALKCTPPSDAILLEGGEL